MASSSGVWVPSQVVDYDALLIETLEPIRDQTFPIDQWTRAELMSEFILAKRFVDVAKIYTSIPDRQIRLELSAKAIAKGFFVVVNECTCKQFYDFCVWLKSNEGSAAITECQKRRQMARKAGDTLTLAEVGLMSIFTEQRAEYNQALKESRAKWDECIAELRKAIALAEEEKRIEMGNVGAEFFPAPEFEEMNDSDLMKKCWELYTAECGITNRQVGEKTEETILAVTQNYQDEVKSMHVMNFLRQGTRTPDLKLWCEAKVLELDQGGEKKRAGSFAPSWMQAVEQWLRKKERSQQRALRLAIVVGEIRGDGTRASTSPLSSLPYFATDFPILTGCVVKPPISRAVERSLLTSSLLERNNRIRVSQSFSRLSLGMIPTSRSKFEMRVRKVIGGGEMLNWRHDNGMYRGGGNFSDALKLLATASDKPPGRILPQCFSVKTARELLFLPCALGVPVTRQEFSMKNFNEEATAGPSLRAFGVYRKEGLKEGLEDFAFGCLKRYADGAPAEDCLPFVTARVGYRTKLLKTSDAMRKISEGSALGRCVMMLDAHEQAFSTPLYNALSRQTHMQRFDRRTGFRNTIVRASSDWSRMWGEVRSAACIVELDWKKFDRERPYEDIEFLVDVICSCFAPGNEYERRFLEGHRIMLRRALLDRPFVTDDGGVFMIEGMVPSGSLWTGWLDTALNILYIRAALGRIGIPVEVGVPKCAGDDNLTLFWEDVGDENLLRLKALLNEWFRAGIEDEDFKIHRPPFDVRRYQAVFPPGTDLSLGTSKMLERAEWVELVDEMLINEEQGLSHRWKYNFSGCPSFLSCYWLADGSPIRPAYVNLEKLLWPEGIHTDIHDYEAALISMAVDNPFNHHNVNHLMHRFCIVQQVKLLASTGVKVDDILFLSRFRAKEGEIVPYPQVAQWRRAEGYVAMENLPRIRRHMLEFGEFVSGITSLYARAPSGGLDAWRYMDLIRNRNPLALRQYGNDIGDWANFLISNPVTKYLKPLRSLRKRKRAEGPPGEENARFGNFLRAHTDPFVREKFVSWEAYACWISEKLKARAAPPPLT
ncbi:TPA_asm: fusion protein [Spinacia oleracea amalgavirus 2]|nr:TPA_asm: fusion protein [Spinacia oleracea amalgavirus 2]